QTWEKTSAGSYRNTGRKKDSVSPEILFVERCIKWLKPGGRLGIVLPDGILGNPGDEYIRWWMMRNCWLIGSVKAPVELFVAEANVGILTSFVFLKKKTEEEIAAEDLGGVKDYPVFMALAEKVGFDRRGNALYKRMPDGEEIVEEVEEVERIRVGGKNITRTLRRRKKIVDDDLPFIVKAFKDFRSENVEPGK
ncbi:N-6 DNA methylase, partial [Pseudomonadota bacterium]